MFDKAMKKSVVGYVEPGEEVLAVAIVQGKGMARAMVAGGVIGASAYGAIKDRKARGAEASGESPVEAVRLASKMGLAITDRRMLVFKAGGSWMLKAKELLSAVPIAEVDSIEIGKGLLTKRVTITVGGEAYPVEAPRLGKPEQLVAALEQAKAVKPAIA